MVDPGRGVGPGVLLVEDHLLPEAQPAAAVLRRASRRRSSRARRGAGSRPAAPRTPRGRWPGPPSPRARRTRRSGAPPASRGPRRGRPRPRRSSSGPRLVPYQANAWFGRQAATSPPAPRRRGAVRRPPGLRRGRRRRSSYADLLDRVRDDRARRTPTLGLGPGDRVVLWGPNSIDWAVAALAVSVRRRRARAGQLALHRARGRRPRRAHPAPRWSWSHDGFLGRDQIARAAPSAGVARPGRRRSQRPGRSAGRGAPTSRPRRRGRARRRGRHPVHLRHHRPVQGRDERAPADHRRRPRLGRARRRPAGRPLPGGQPVLPLLRLQDRHRGRPAHRRDALPGRDLRRRRDDAADRVRADHRASRARRRSTSRCSTRPAAPSATCPRCGSPSPARPSYPSC